MSEITEVAGFGVALDRAYDPAGHFWVSMVGGRLRPASGWTPSASRPAAPSPSSPSCPSGEHLKRGEAFGSLEAAKFVGPLTSPLSGTVTATNDAVVVDPALVERDPYGDGWLVELDAGRSRRARRAGLRRRRHPRLVRGRGRGLPPEGGAGRMTTTELSLADGTHRRVRPPPGQLRRHHRVLRPRPEALGDTGVEADQPQAVPAGLGHRLGLRPVLRPLPGQGAGGDDLGQGRREPLRPGRHGSRARAAKGSSSPAGRPGPAACRCSATSSTSPGSRTSWG